MRGNPHIICNHLVVFSTYYVITDRSHRPEYHPQNQHHCYDHDHCFNRENNQIGRPRVLRTRARVCSGHNKTLHCGHPGVLFGDVGGDADGMVGELVVRLIMMLVVMRIVMSMVTVMVMSVVTVMVRAIMKLFAVLD